jgi:hypothetical protein
MGHDQRTREARERTDLAQKLGPVRDFAWYAGGCPKCGGTEFNLAFCFGADKDAPPDANCVAIGEHLHVDCNRCHFQHLTLTRDSEMNPVKTSDGQLVESFMRQVIAALIRAEKLERIDVNPKLIDDEKDSRVYITNEGGVYALRLVP